jgi:hypothetical protein
MFASNRSRSFVQMNDTVESLVNQIVAGSVVDLQPRITDVSSHRMEVVFHDVCKRRRVGEVVREEAKDCQIASPYWIRAGLSLGED